MELKRMRRREIVRTESKVQTVEIVLKLVIVG